MLNRFLLILACLVIATPALADIQGSVWLVPEAIAKDAIPGNVPITAPDATFTLHNGAINLYAGSFYGTGYTIGDFITNGGGTCSGAACSSIMDANGIGSLFELVGQVTVTNGMDFTVTHDDGLTLVIGGTNLGFSAGPTSPITTTLTWGGPSGTFDFQLVYGECCGQPAKLQTSLPLEPVPEPASLLLLGSGLIGIGSSLRKLWM